jgi:hypothetical protein
MCHIQLHNIFNGNNFTLLEFLTYEGCYKQNTLNTGSDNFPYETNVTTIYTYQNIMEIN